MQFTDEYSEARDAIAEMFFNTFARSEGAEPARLIRYLVVSLLASLSHRDISVFSAVENRAIVASIIFTRMRYDQDPRRVFILGPVAVATDMQGKGVGQRLIRHGLEKLRDLGVDVALTYGDLNFYSKVGFRQITETEARPPRALSHPHGWLGQSLAGPIFEPLVGPSRCVAPLDDPNHW